MLADKCCGLNQSHIISTVPLLYKVNFVASNPVVPWLSYSPLDPRFAGSNLAGVDGFFSERKNPEYDFLRKGSKAVGPVS